MTTSRPALFPPAPEEDPAYLKEQIITYIGNKRKLLPFIGKALNVVRRRLDKPLLSSVDLFSGSGIVARYLKGYSESVIANDLEAYSHAANECYLSNRSEASALDLPGLLEDLKHTIGTDMEEGFITELYAPRDESNITSRDRVFYTRRNAKYLDSACRALDKLAPGLRKYFLGPLLSEASIHANTSGVFKGFYKSGDTGQFGGAGRNALSRILGEITLSLPLLSRFEVPYTIHCSDANQLVKTLPETDLIYLDPPYNQHPYASNYFMLNLLVDYKRPDKISNVSGIPAVWNKSDYNRRQTASQSLFRLVEDCRAKFILISYNSEGFITLNDFKKTLSPCGRLTLMEMPYNTFRGSRNLKNRPLHVKEFLFLLEKN